MKFLIFIATISFFCIVSCNSNKYTIENLKTISISPDSNSLIKTDEFLKNTQIKNIDNQLIAYWVNYRASSFHVFNFSTNEKINIKLDSSIIKSINGTIDYQMLNENEVGFYSWRNKKLFILNIRNYNINKYDFAACLDKKDSKIVPSSSKQFPFIYNGDKLSFFCVYSDLFLNNITTIKKYFSLNNTITINISDTKCTYYTFGHFPANYQKGNTYADYFFYNCMNDVGELIYSFSANDSIFVYSENGEFIKQYEAKSKYSKEFLPYDLSKRLDLNYKRQYVFSNDWYTNIVYDKYRKLYYRFYKKEVSYLNDKNKIRKPNEIPWSLIVLDKNFNKINEIDINPAKYSLKHLIPMKEGVYVGHPYEEDIKNNNLSLTLLKFNNDF